MRPIEPALFEQELRGIEVMRDWVLGDWRSATAFERDERGFCLVRGDELVGWCASEYTCQPKPKGPRACELGIYTCEGYRRRGFATLTAAATVERCLAEGITHIGWHCWASNLGSAATARKVGFELAADYPVWNACFNAFDNLLLQAHYHNQAGRTQEALARWEQAFQMWEAQDPEALRSPHLAGHPGTVGWCYYAAGQARAQMGERERALRHLNHALDNGWQDLDRLREDEALAGLRGMEEWEMLLRRVVGP
jgi:RimJ/RimL family protein N-acetyltransferase